MSEALAELIQAAERYQAYHDEKFYADADVKPTGLRPAIAKARAALSAAHCVQGGDDRQCRLAAIAILSECMGPSFNEGAVLKATEILSKRGAFAQSESAALTIEDKRWRFLEHGCQWVSWTPIGGETVSFDPRDMEHLKAMRDSADKTLHEHVARLRDEAHALERRLKK